MEGMGWKATSYSTVEPSCTVTRLSQNFGYTHTICKHQPKAMATQLAVEGVRFKLHCVQCFNRWIKDVGDTVQDCTHDVTLKRTGPSLSTTDATPTG